MRKNKRIIMKLLTAILAVLVIVAVLILPCFSYYKKYEENITSSTSNKYSMIKTVYASKITPLMILKAKNATIDDLNNAKIEYDKKYLEIEAKYIEEGKSITQDNSFNRELAATKEANTYYAIYLTIQEDIQFSGEFKFGVDEQLTYQLKLDENTKDFIQQIKMYRIIILATLNTAFIVLLLSIMRLVFDHITHRIIHVISCILLFIVTVTMFIFPFFMDITGKYVIDLGSILGSQSYFHSSYCEPTIISLIYIFLSTTSMIFGLISCKLYKN